MAEAEEAREIHKHLDVVQHCVTAISVMSYRRADEQEDLIGSRGIDAILFLANLASDKLEAARDGLFALDLAHRSRRDG